MKPPTTNELLEALRAASPTALRPTDVFTVTTLQQQTGWSRKRLCEHLWALKQAGQLEVVHIHQEQLDGRMRPRPAYRFLAPKRKR